MKGMKPWSKRSLTAGERAALSAGLAAALDEAGVSPQIAARPSLMAIIAALWRGSTPVMVLGRTIFWPGAVDDFSADPRRMALLQHELQHVLEFRTGVLTRLGYAFSPRNWIYRYPQDAGWSALGAEQRAQAAQDYWLAERGLLKDGPSVERLAALIPWASKGRRLYAGDTRED